MENFVLYDEVGRGDRSVIYKGRKKGTIEYVAIHCVEKSKRKDLQNYVRISHELSHRNVVKFYEWYETSNHLWLVVELCTGESLENILTQDTFLPEPTVQSFAKDIVEGLFYLHSLDILYCDLCPSKILLDGSNTLKFSNFTLAKIEGEQQTPNEVYSEDEEAVGRLGSPTYMSPEILQGAQYTKVSDMWSLGCILYEMFSGMPPFTADTFQELADKILNADISYPMQGKNSTFIKASENLYMLIQGLLQKDPMLRIDWLELCVHPFWEGSLNHIADILESSGLVSYDELELEKVIKILFASSLQVEKKQYLVDKRPQSVPEESLKARKDKLRQEEEKRESVTPKGKIGSKTYKLDKALAVADLAHVGSASFDNSRVRNANNHEQYCKARENKARKETNTVDGSLVTDSLSTTLVNLDSDVQYHIGPNLSIIDLLYHPADLSVSPIAENPKIQKLNNLKWEQHNLPFSSLSLEALLEIDKGGLTNHLDLIHHSVFQSNLKGMSNLSPKQKLNCAAYLWMISKLESVANLMVDKDFVKPMLMEIKVTSSHELKKRLGRVLGYIATSATFISPDFNMTDVFMILTESIRENFRNVSLKQALLPALGEFLFFAATQEEGDEQEIKAWDPPGASFIIIAKCINQGEDITVQHIAAKIVENIATTTGRHCQKFLSHEISQGLWNLYSHAVSDAEKMTAASALCRVSMHSSALAQHLVDRAGYTAVSEALFSGTQRTQQAFLTIFVNLLSSPSYAKRIFQDHSSVQRVIHLLESPGLVLRGKIYLFVTEIASRSLEALLVCCQARLVTYMERDSKKSSTPSKAEGQGLAYVNECLSLAANSIARVVPSVFEGATKVLSAISGRQHPSSAQVKQLRANLPLIKIVLHLVTSQVFRSKLISSSFIQLLGVLLRHVRAIDSGQINISSVGSSYMPEEMTETVFSIIEAIAQHPPLLLQFDQEIIEHILPLLASFSSSHSGDHRMLSLKLFSDIASLFLEDDVLEKTPRNNDSETSLQSLREVIVEHFLPHFNTILQDQDPMPGFGLKLLQAYLERDYEVVPQLIDSDLVSTLLSLLQRHQGDSSSSVLQHVISILNTVVCHSKPNFVLLCKQGLIDYLTSAFVEVSSVLDSEKPAFDIAPLFLQLLDTLHHVLKNIEAAVKAVVQSKDVHSAEARAFAKEVEELLIESKVLSELNGLLITLLVYEDQDIQEWACRCLYLCAELFGGEYEECFVEDNVECLAEALQLAVNRRKKLLLRIIKRFLDSNMQLQDSMKSNGELLIRQIELLTKIDVTDSDSKAVQSVASDLIQILSD